MAADENALGKLHEKVANVLSDALDGTTIPAITDEDGTVIQAETKLKPSAAEITAAIQFLKNNNVTCVADESNALGRLKDKMEEREKRRAARRAKPDQTDLAAATEQSGWLSGHIGNA